MTEVTSGLYLSERRGLRLMTLCALYVAQGVPFGFVTYTLSAWLSANHGYTTEQLGPVLAMTTLPWSFKFVWGPLIDRFTIPSMGRRRPWILFAQGMAVITLGSMIFVPDLSALLWEPDADTARWKSAVYQLVPGPLAAMIFLSNVFLSMQDVSVDALAVDLVPEDERGKANGLMYGSSYFGTAIGGSVLGVVVARFGIRAGLAGQALILMSIMLLPFFIRERRVDSQPEQTQDSDAIRTSLFMDLIRGFTVRSAFVGGLLALTVKIGFGVLTAVFVDYLLKKDGGGWTQEDYSVVTGGYAVILGLAGAVAGGFLADRFGARLVIALTSVLLGALWAAFGILPELLAHKSAVTVMLIGQEFIMAVMSVALFSLFMTVSWPRIAATQFTTYMAIMNLSATIGSYIAGSLKTELSVFAILILAGTLQAVLIAPLLLIDPHQTRRVLGET